MDVVDKNFWSVIAQIDGTALAVLFVAFERHAPGWQTSKLKKMSAVRALTELLVPLVMSLLFLVQPVRWQWSPRVAGVLGVVVLAMHAVSFARNKTRDRYDWSQLAGSSVSLVIYVLIFRTSLGTEDIVLGVNKFDFLEAVAVWLLFSVFVEAWWLLHLGQWWLQPCKCSLRKQPSKRSAGKTNLAAGAQAARSSKPARVVSTSKSAVGVTLVGLGVIAIIRALSHRSGSCAPGRTDR